MHENDVLLTGSPVVKRLVMSVHSETDILRTVIVHEPDFGIEKVTPDVAEELLYDDIVYLPRMVEEHRVFTQSLKAFLGAGEVLDFEDLLIDVLHDAQTRHEVLEEVGRLDGLSSEFCHDLEKLAPAVLGKTLIAGVKSIDGKEHLLPLPNLIFTRDLGVAINDHFVICSSKTRARRRESLLSSFVFTRHPRFAELARSGRVIDLYRAFSEMEGGHALEGGDVMIINHDHVFIGCSERSDDYAVKYLADILLGRGIVKCVSQIDIPPKRYCMHLDTVFTMIDEHACVGFKPLMFEANDEVQVVRYEGSLAHARKFGSVRDLIRDIIPDINCIPCGGGHSPYQEREQWTDGSNLVALRAGVFYGYERNYHTSEKLRDFGYRVEHAVYLNDFLQAGPGKAAAVEKALITLPSGELSRARGGSHCMTLPVRRDPAGSTN